MNKRYDEMLDPFSVCSSGGGGGFLTKNAKIDQATSMKMPVEMRDRVAIARVFSSLCRQFCGTRRSLWSGSANATGSCSGDRQTD